MFKEGFKSGFVSIIGRPNVGKSTFLNRVIGQKIAIMSDKPQTTRNKIQGVYTTEDVQTIFIDTPGIHKPKHKLGDFMMKVATNALREVDAILFMVNVTEPKGKGDDFIIEKLKELDTPIILVMNKVDLIHPNDIPPIIESYKMNSSLRQSFRSLRYKVTTSDRYLKKSRRFYQKDQCITRRIKSLTTRSVSSSQR